MQSRMAAPEPPERKWTDRWQELYEDYAFMVGATYRTGARGQHYVNLLYENLEDHMDKKPYDAVVQPPMPRREKVQDIRS
jgi:hypothetical protein